MRIGRAWTGSDTAPENRIQQCLTRASPNHPTSSAADGAGETLLTSDSCDWLTPTPPLGANPGPLFTSDHPMCGEGPPRGDHRRRPDRPPGTALPGPRPRPRRSRRGRVELASDLSFAVVDLASGRAVGSTRYLEIRPEHRALEIGGKWYAIASRRTGVNTECKFLLL